MPGASGAVLVRGFRRVGLSAPVFGISGLAEEAYENLNVSFLNRPCPPWELIRPVRDAVQRNT
jgi:hypothetical protein